ncbi:MAG: hypothetical protein ACTS22_07055 [Phycisphaerales bacterium]
MAPQRSALLTALLLLASPLAGGCATVWEENYRPISDASSLPSGEKISIREIPWERMERAIEDSRQRIVESDTHPADWDEHRQRDARADLLNALQVAADPDSARVIGVSSFRTTDVVKPWDGSLVGFAREVGANTVVWSDRYLGKAQAIVDRTIYIDRIDYGRRGDEDRSRIGTETATVPVVVNRDERGYTAFFLYIER